MKRKAAGIRKKTKETVDLLKNFEFVHSLLLFGSTAREKTGRDIDICIIPSRELSMEERLTVESVAPSGIDLSVLSELPVHIRKRIFEERKVLYTKDMYHLLTLGKETDLEYRGYRRYRDYYNKAMRERIKNRLGKKGERTAT